MSANNTIGNKPIGSKVYPFGTQPTLSEIYAYGRPESAHFEQYRAPTQSLYLPQYATARTVVHRHSTNTHLPLLAYEVAEMEQPINWVIEIATVLLAAIVAGFVVFVLGW